MSISRRSFLQTSAAGAAVALLASPTHAFARRQPAGAGRGGKRILMLGGTGFLGPAVVDAALASGHTVTLFNRGLTEQRTGETFPECEHLRGDRDPNRGDGLKALEGREWDAVVDTSGYYPRLVAASAGLLAPRVKQYVFISSISAYASSATPDADETAPVGTMADPTIESMGASYENYGPLKALCEQAAEAAFPGRATNIRPGYIVGPGDPTDRFTYWPIRVSQGGDVLAPGTPQDPVQIIDVRDLGEWIVRTIELETYGVFNAVGPAKMLTMGETLDACVEASPKPATLMWVPADFLEVNADSGEGGSLPIWIPPMGEYAGFHRWSNARAVNAGLKFRPVVDTCRDLVAWWPKELERRVRVTKQMIEDADKNGQPAPQVGDPSRMRAGLTLEREAALLALWKEHAGKG